MRHFTKYIIMLVVITLWSCQVSKKPQHIHIHQDMDVSGFEPEVHYAKGFSIHAFSDYKIVRIYNPWQGAKQIAKTYLLHQRGMNPPDSIKVDQYIEIPVRSMVCLSTTHIGFIEILDEINSIVGISGASLVNNEIVLERVRSGEVQDVGYDQNLNKELLISLNPDLIMAYSVANEFSGLSTRLKDLGLSMVLNAEFLEEHPLGKTEWIKFVGAFYQKDELADSLFRSIEAEYKQIRDIVVNVEDKPVVMTGLPWKDNWYVPGTESYAVNLIHDAGGSYLWESFNSNQPVALSLEQVFSQSTKADIWINAGIASSLGDIQSTDERLGMIPAYKNGQVFNNNKILSVRGGNDYWESGLVHPHLILKDLIRIFHPNLLEHELIYYHHLE